MLQTPRCALALLAALACAAPSLAAPPANAMGELLFKAREADGMQRLKSMMAFDAGRGDEGVVLIELKGRDDHIESEFVEVRASGAWRGERCKLAMGGVLLGYSAARAEKLGDPKKEDIAEGKVEGQTLVMKRGEEERKIELPQGPTVSLPLAIFVIPAYYDLIPADGLEFHALLEGDLGPKVKVTLGKQEGESQQVLFKDEGDLSLEVWVSTADKTKGAIEKVVIGGSLKRRLSEEEFGQRMQSIEAKAGLGKRKAAEEATPRGTPAPTPTPRGN